MSPQGFLPNKKGFLRSLKIAKKLMINLNSATFFSQVHKFFLNFWPIPVIFIIVASFFIRLYFPPSLFITPNHGQSDIIHTSFAEQYLLSENLRSFKIPLWRNEIGQGFPLASAGTWGIFYLPNLIIFSILPFQFALPSVYLANFLIAAFGMFFLLRFLKLGNFSSLFGSISFTFSASMVVRIIHINILQTVSLCPWVFLIFISLIKKPNLRKGLITSFLLSQMFFANFPQLFIYFMIFLFILLLIYFLFKREEVKVSLLVLALVFVFSLMLSAVQLLPLAELKNQSLRLANINPYGILHDFPLLPKNFLAYLNPFIVGTPANGTYNSLEWSKTGMFWENTGYIGLVPFIFALFSAVYLFVRRQKNDFLFIAIILLISVLLSLGKFSPFYFLFFFPPFKLFRVPARFTLFTQFFMVILAAWGIKKIVESYVPSRFRNFLYLILIILTTGELFVNWWSYNPIDKISSWLERPQTAQAINLENGDYRIYSLGAKDTWNKIFVNEGWQGKEDYYRFFRNSLDENLNVVYNLDSFSGNLVLPISHYSLSQIILAQNISESHEQIKINENAKKLLDLSSVKYLVSSKPVEAKGYKQIFETSKDEFKVAVYESDTPQKRVSMHYDILQVNNPQDYLTIFDKLNPAKTVLVEKPLNKSFEEGQGSVNILKSQDGYLDLDVSTDKDGILVFSDSPYPGWEAKIDSNPAEIFVANINSKATVVPAGNHKVIFSYEPKSFKTGASVSLLSFIILITLMINPKILNPLKRFVPPFLL